MIPKSVQFLIALSISAGAPCINCSQPATAQHPLHRAEVKRLVKNAHTPEEFDRLSAYFEQRANAFELKAEKDEKELIRLRALPFRSKSYPVQVQSTANNLTANQSEAKKSSEMARVYYQRATEPLLASGVDPLAETTK